MKLVVKIIVACAIILSVCLTRVSAWRSFKVIFSKFDYQANSNYVDVKIQILNNTGETTLNVAFNVLEPLDDVTIAATIGLEAVNGNYTTLLSRTANLCKFLKQRSSEPVFRMIFDDLQRHGNLFKECPIKKGAYTIQEYRLDEEMLPSYLPETNFLVKIQISTSANLMLFSGELTGRIDKSKGFNNLKMFSLG